MSTLLFVGICLVVLGVGGRVAVGRGDASRMKKAVRSGGPEPRPSNGKKRAANAGTGAGIIAIIASLDQRIRNAQILLETSDLY